MKKITFENIKNVLSRHEMKKIMAGSGGGTLCSTETQTCCTDSDCGSNCYCYKPYGQSQSACYTRR